MNKGIPCKKGWISSKKKCILGTSNIAKVSRNIILEESKIRRNHNEQMIIIDSQNGDVLERSKSGTPTSCEISDGSTIKGNILTHNHPEHVAGIAQSFSMADVKTASTFEAAELRAITPTYTYSISPKKGAWNQAIWEKKIEPAYKKSYKDVERQMVGDLRAGKVTMNNKGFFSVDPHHLVWEKTAEVANLNYKRELYRSRSDAASILPSNGTKTNLLDTTVSAVLNRVYPGRVGADKILAVRNNEISGVFFDKLNKKRYSFTINPLKGDIFYKKDAILDHLDAKRPPTCTVGTLCYGKQGSGCISVKKNCLSKLNRFSTPMERVILRQATMSPPDQGIPEYQEAQVPAVQEKKLQDLTIRELKTKAQDANVWRYSDLDKDGLVYVLSNLKHQESRSGGEDILAKTAKKREQALYNRPVTAAEAAARGSKSKAVKKALGIFFPGATRVYDDFAKARRIEDKAVAGLAATVIIAGLVYKGSDNYQRNYEKSVKDQGKEVTQPNFYGKDYSDLEDHFENRTMTHDQAKTEREDLDENKFPSADTAKKYKEDFMKGGKVDAEIDFWKEQIKKDVAEREEKTEARLGKKSVATASSIELEESLLARNDLVMKGLNRIQEQHRDAIDAAKESGVKNIKVPKYNLGDLEAKIKEGKIAIPPERQSVIDTTMKSYSAFSQERQKEIRSTLEFNERLNIVDDEIRKAPKRSISTVAAEEEIKAIDKLITYNMGTHAGKVNNRLVELRARQKATNIELENFRTEIGKERMSVDKTAEARRKEAIANGKPLIPDYAKDEALKPSNRKNEFTPYQAWTVSRYKDLISQKGSIAKAREAIRDNPDLLSKKAYFGDQNVVFFVGSNTAKASEMEEAVRMLSKRGREPITFSKAVENSYSDKAAMGDTSSDKGIAYLQFMGRHAKGVLPVVKIPGYSPELKNTEAVTLAAKLLSAADYGINPKVVTHGTGGNLTREALDIIAAIDPSAVKKIQVLSFGSPNIGASPARVSDGVEQAYHGTNDFFGGGFHPKKSKKVGAVRNGTFSGYFASPEAKGIIESFINKKTPPVTSRKKRT